MNNKKEDCPTWDCVDLHINGKVINSVKHMTLSDAGVSSEKLLNK